MRRRLHPPRHPPVARATPHTASSLLSALYLRHHPLFSSRACNAGMHTPCPPYLLSLASTTHLLLPLPILRPPTLTLNPRAVNSPTLNNPLEPSYAASALLDLAVARRSTSAVLRLAPLVDPALCAEMHPVHSVHPVHPVHPMHPVNPGGGDEPPRLPLRRVPLAFSLAVRPVTGASLPRVREFPVRSICPLSQPHA